MQKKKVGCGYGNSSSAEHDRRDRDDKGGHQQRDHAAVECGGVPGEACQRQALGQEHVAAGDADVDLLGLYVYVWIVYILLSVY